MTYIWLQLLNLLGYFEGYYSIIGRLKSSVCKDLYKFNSQNVAI